MGGPTGEATDLATMLASARACTVCSPNLPAGPRPVLAAHPEARIAVVGQAPGTKVHRSGVPWDDDSGDHLREWLAIDKNAFMDPRTFAILPMGFCYPGKGEGGDLPPRPECAPLWHPRLLAAMPQIQLTPLIGQYAQRYYLGPRRKKTLTATTRAFEEYLPRLFPLPHPSWRSRIWMKKHPWFASEVLPALRRQVSAALAPTESGS